jgi:hypothetical protein
VDAFNFGHLRLEAVLPNFNLSAPVLPQAIIKFEVRRDA